jgi:NitT/TauT family transport system ATP-binding protein
VGAIDLTDVSKRFTLRIDGAEQSVEALSNLSFSVRDGEIVALIGPSGCGKTTALRIAMGLESASGGRVTVDGIAVTGCGHDRGMVFQHAALLPWLTALENVMFGLEMKGLRGDALRATAQRYLDLVGLKESGGRRPYQLSGGMQQRVGIARALAIDPKVLLMDEPFGALDAQTREALQGELITIHARTAKTILFVTHDLDEALYVAQRVILLSSSPGTIAQNVPVPLPYPRLQIETRSEPEYLRLREHLYRNMVAQVMAGRADVP